MTLIIYGGSGGIGSALARTSAARGEALHLVGRNAAALSALAADTGASFTVGDVAEDDLPARVMAESPGPVTGLAYAIGSIRLRPVARLTAADYRADFELNALGALRAVQAALPVLKDQPGAAILLFSTVAVGQGFTGHTSVAMAKGAIEGLTLALAAELAPKVRVNCIAPSLTRTALAAPLISSEQMASAIAQAHPLQRLGEPDDIAGLADFLLSPRAGWITGQIIGVDGGRSTLRTKG